MQEIRVEEEYDSDVRFTFRREVEIRQFRLRALKNIQCNPYLWPNRQNFRALQEIGIEEHDGEYKWS